mmetsp:Transcript_98307/g.225697  ORF Transcript_98307/g.225697 Transcript_98307/m.225697 type:complete len:267 (+) Transcript_98307:1102-1902(+)
MLGYQDHSTTALAVSKTDTATQNRRIHHFMLCQCPLWYRASNSPTELCGDSGTSHTISPVGGLKMCVRCPSRDPHFAAESSAHRNAKHNRNHQYCCHQSKWAPTLLVGHCVADSDDRQQRSQPWRTTRRRLWGQLTVTLRREHGKTPTLHRGGATRPLALLGQKNKPRQDRRPPRTDSEDNDDQHCRTKSVAQPCPSLESFQVCCKSTGVEGQQANAEHCKAVEERQTEHCGCPRQLCGQNCKQALRSATTVGDGRRQPQIPMQAI